jgi:glycosyltransferase involved in cell wall biosynthesis
MRHLIELFNRYAQIGGEEIIADRILERLRLDNSVESIRWDSREWQNIGAPALPIQVLRMFHNRQSALRLAEAIRSKKPEAIICHNIYPIASPSVYRAAYRMNVPIVQFTHNFRPFSVSGTLWTGTELAEQGLKGNFTKEVLSGSWQESRLKSLIMAAVLKTQIASGSLSAVKKWVAISEFMRSKFIEAGIPQDRVVTLRHFWEPNTNCENKSDDGYYLYLGRLVIEKGIRTLLEAWHHMFAESAASCPVLVICGTGPLEDEVRAAVEKCPKIRFYGFVGGVEKVAIISKARALIAPSIWWEPLGLVTYESYDQAKPVLAARSGGLLETVIQDETGFLHEPGNAESLASDIMRMEKIGMEQRQAMGRKGREWLMENTCPVRWKQSMDNIISSVVDG